ncbi:hypothetical protein ACFUJX_19745 [Streptomyces rubiginosohelvolus]|uniref:hypothetical protein n=1 Tax=Streptomyces TaxID=1883 RepID=UPI0035E06EEA
MTEISPAEQLRAAAELLREAAGHATPGPWRTHDTHLGGVGGHTATVLTDRPNTNDTELIAWLPTMSHEPWDEARNAWRNAGWVALMHPGVGLAVAALLADYADDWHSCPEDHPGTKLDEYALALARQVLGTEPVEDLCGKTRGIGTSVPYRPCARPAGHSEAYCRDATGDHMFLAASEEAHP